MKRKQDRGAALMSRRTFVAATSAAAAASALPSWPAVSQPADKVTIGTSWQAEAEHGGFYQALATGLYRKNGLDVTIRQGGPQMRYSLLLAAGQIEFNMGESFTALNYVKENVPLCCIAAPFQKDVRVLLSHAGAGNDTFRALKGKPILIAGSSRTTYWEYLKAKYGYTDDQVRPYTFSLAPFLVDKSLTQQGYLTSEPFQMEQAGVKPVIHLLADDGYDNFANTLETSWKLVQEKPDMVQRFVNATIEGWYSYLYQDPSPGNALIKKDNPEMTDDVIAYAIRMFKQHQILDSGDAAKLGIGAMTDRRWTAFRTAMLPTGMYSADLDLSKAYTLKFVNQAHGVNMRT